LTLFISIFFFFWFSPTLEVC